MKIVGAYEAEAVRPSTDGTMQPCTSCGAEGHWSEPGFQGYYAAPHGHAKRPDGTMDCPSSPRLPGNQS